MSETDHETKAEQPNGKPVPVPVNGWVVVEGKYPMYLKDGRAYHCERDAQTGEAPVHSMSTVERGIMKGRIKALFRPDEQKSEPEPEPVVPDGWVVVGSIYPRYVKDGFGYYSKEDADRGVVPAYSRNAIEGGFANGRIKPLVLPQSTPALRVTPEMLDVAARGYFYATTLYAPEEGREDDWPTRIPHRVRETIRDGLVAALDALEENRMVETDYVHGRTVTPEQLDRIARHLYARLRDGSWDSLENRETPEWEDITVHPANDDIEWRIAVQSALFRVGIEVEGSS